MGHMRKLLVALPVLLVAGLLILSDLQAKCGVNSISTRRCEDGGWRTVVTCHDGVSRTMARGHSSGGPEGCFERRRYSASRSEIRGFCENRCDPRIVPSCVESPSLDNLIGAMCDRIHACREDISVAYCRENIEEVSASDELGLAESEGEITFAVIREALTDGRVEWDGDVYCHCLYSLRNDASCSGVSPVEPFGEGMVEEIIPEQCGNDAYPGTLLPDGFNPVTGSFE